MDWMLISGMALSAVFAALGGVLILAAAQARGLRQMPGHLIDRPGETAFLFDGEVLVDATPEGRRLMSLGPQAGSPLDRLTGWLGPRFPGLTERMAALPAEGRFVLQGTCSATADRLLHGEWRGGLTRLRLSPASDSVDGTGQDALMQHAVEQELASLRSMLARAPFPIWRETAAGSVVWANTAYLVEAAPRQDPGKDPARDLTWPLPALFDPATKASHRHHALVREGGVARWFDVKIFDEPDGRLGFALPADAVVQAEVSLREFMQTLTKTFAHLPIGLAIFDRQRQLALFNPALMDLSGLEPDFLTMRPTLFAFLDEMRDRNSIPEPQDYRSWRRQMTDLEEAAASGLYEETWNLPQGRTYRVVGHPHPNGALALMFEDISTEMSRNRRYRADLELGQAVIDGIDEAIAVFSQSGLLVMSNAAYAALWGHDPSSTLGEAGIGALCAHWSERSAPTAFWTEAEGFVATLGRRGRCAGEVRLGDGRLIDCRFKALQGGSTLACFRIAGSAPATDDAPLSLMSA